MRKLSKVSTPILNPIVGRQRSFDRRPVRAVFDSLQCLAVVRHQETATELFISSDGDATGAVWVRKSCVLIDAKDRGNFLVITISKSLAREKHLSVSLFDWDRYTPGERAMLKDALESAQRTRMRLSGQSSNRPTWSGGRNVYA